MQRTLERSWRKLYSYAAQKIVRRYIQKERRYTYKGLRLKVYKHVFHPGLFRSTEIFAQWLEQMDVHNKRVLELGCGTGLLSLVAAHKGAVVTAADINPKAVANASENAGNNGLIVTAVLSDLFAALSAEEFDMVLINPPYFPKAPVSDYERAWYCGEDFSYFKNLFRQLRQRPAIENYYMILSDRCDLVAIHDIAIANASQLKEQHTKKMSGELFVIYNICKTTG